MFLVVYTEAAKVMVIGSGIPVHPMIPVEYAAPVQAAKTKTEKKAAKDFIGEKLAFAQQVWKDHKKEILNCGIMIAEMVVMKKVSNKEDIAKMAINAAKKAVDKM